MEARADALPRDYRIVYAEIMQYMWKFNRDVLRQLGHAGPQD